MNWAFLLLCALAPVLSQESPRESAFQGDLDKIHRQMELQRWSSARDGLQRLLEKHTGESFIAAHVPTLREDARRCAFWIGHKAPEWDSLVEGELSHWRPRSKRLKLTYNADETADFDRRGARMFHPLEFDGPHMITLRGEHYPAPEDERSAPVIWIGTTTDTAVVVSFGYAATGGRPGAPLRIVRIEGDTPEVLAELSPSPVRAGQAYELAVEVRTSEIRLHQGRKRLLTAQRVRVPRGRFGIENAPEYDSLEIDGTVTGSWLLDRMDSAMRSEWQRFDETYREERHLPAWLLNGEFNGTPRAAEPERKNAAWVEELRRAQTENGLEGGLSFARDLGQQGISVREQSIATALALYDLERYEDCRLTCDNLLLRNTRDIDAKIIRARSQARLRRVDDAVADYRSALILEPRSLVVHIELAELLLIDGRPLEAKSVIEKALGQGLKSERIDALTRTLTKALRGPEWALTHRHESRHYEVLSDIDGELCREAADVLEDAYRMFQGHLATVRDTDERRFKVYLFSGQASYLAYARDAFGHQRPEATWGLYSPALKQLLIWNLPAREDMLRTVRHEGFHQYFDWLTHGAPTWFDEGLAEYYEVAESLRGRRRPAPVQREHVEYLRATEQWVPLTEFVAMPAADFYANARHNYAQAWALVHFLRHGGSQPQGVFQKLLRGLMVDSSNADVLAEAFGRVRIEDLEQDFRAYVMALK